MSLFKGVICMAVLCPLCTVATDCDRQPSLCSDHQDEVSLLQVVSKVELGKTDDLVRAFRNQQNEVEIVKSDTEDPMIVQPDLAKIKTVQEKIYVWKYAAEAAKMAAVRAQYNLADSAAQMDQYSLKMENSAHIASEAESKLDEAKGAVAAAEAGKKKALQFAEEAHKIAKGKAEAAEKFAKEAQNLTMQMATARKAAHVEAAQDTSEQDAAIANAAAEKAGKLYKLAKELKDNSTAAMTKAKAKFDLATKAEATQKAASEKAKETEVVAIVDTDVAEQSDADAAAANKAPSKATTTTAAPAASSTTVR